MEAHSHEQKKRVCWCLMDSIAKQQTPTPSAPPAEGKVRRAWEVASALAEGTNTSERKPQFTSWLIRQLKLVSKGEDECYGAGPDPGSLARLLAFGAVLDPAA